METDHITNSPFSISRIMDEMRENREGARKPLTKQQAAKRKIKNKMARASRRTNRTA